MIQVVFLAIFAILLARVMRAPAGTWRYIVAAAILVLAASQLLPEGNAFRENVRASAVPLFWLALALVPVVLYALVIRRIRRRTLGPGDPASPAATAHPTGLVLVPEDGAFARDTEAALDREAGGDAAHLSIGWRDAAGEMVGHARFRLARGIAAIELLWVAERARGQGIGARLLERAGIEARLRGARDLLATATTPEAARWLERRGFRPYGRFDGTDGGGHLHLHKALD